MNYKNINRIAGQLYDKNVGEAYECYKKAYEAKEADDEEMFNLYWDKAVNINYKNKGLTDFLDEITKLFEQFGENTDV